MKFTFYHNNINVADLDKSIEFYKKALGLKVTKETVADDGSFIKSNTFRVPDGSFYDTPGVSTHGYALQLFHTLSHGPRGHNEHNEIVD